MTRAFIFDLDGVLVDSERYYYNLRMNFMRNLGEQPGSIDINDYVGTSYLDGLSVMIPNAHRRAELAAKYKEYNSTHLINYAEYLNPGARSFLLELKEAGYTIALASAGLPAGIQRMLEQCALQQLFDVVLSGVNVERNKPAPDIYLECLKQLNMAAEDIVVVEDSTIGIQSAKAAGLRTWAFHDTRYQVDQQQADHVFDGFSAMQQQLAKL